MDKDLKKSMERLNDSQLGIIFSACNYPGGNQRSLRIAEAILAERKKRKMQQNKKEVGAWTW